MKEFDSSNTQVHNYGNNEDARHVSATDTNSHGTCQRRLRPGFFITSKLALILILIVLVALIAVGWIVWFGVKPGAVTCVCQCASSSSTGSGSSLSSSESSTTRPSNRTIGAAASLSDCFRDWGYCMIAEQCMRTTPSTAVTPAPVQADVRLPRNLLPVHYNVELRPDFYGNDTSTFAFDGRVQIFLSCIKATNQLMVHANLLKINDISFVDLAAPDRQIRVISFAYTESVQYHTVTFDSNTEPGHQYVWSASFKGPLKADMVGLYLSSYEMDNRTHYLVTTQFQATDARKAFPCLDEPDMKATFNITLLRKHWMHSIANMPLIRSENRSNDWVADTYDKTVVMPTYLLAFIVCNFDYRTTYDSKGRAYRIFARPNAIAQTSYAVDISPRILEYFEEYFNISYALPKIDMIAIPDFSAGAMENWGLVTYREHALLFDPLTDASIKSKQRVAIIASHEIAHQWFGNLVTMAWWDDLWLNEGFASYVEYLGVNKLSPEWSMDQLIVLEDIHEVMKLDSLQSSHPIYVPVKKPEEISEIFDKISYAKGATICRMVNFFLSEPVFKRGLKRYLNRHKFANAHHTALWKALTEQATEEKLDINVTTVMHNWTVSKGYPVVKLVRVGNDIKVTQEHFLLDRGPADNSASASRTIWHVPLTFVTNESSEINWEQQPIKWLSQESMQLTEKDGIPRNASNWILANIREFGYYRVNYDAKNWKLLIDQLMTNHLKIDVINRAQIIDDAFNLARAGMLNYQFAMDITKYLRNERDFLPWQTMFVNLDHIDAMLSKSFYYGHFRKYLVGQIEPIYRDLGWEEKKNESVLTGYLRTAIVGKACTYGLDACVNKAREIFKQWQNRTEKLNVNANLRAVMMCTGIRYGDWSDWLWLYNRFRGTNTAAERSVYLSAMACSREVWVLHQYLERAINTKEIRPQDFGNVLNEVARNPVGRYLTLEFIKQFGSRLQSFGGFSFWPYYLSVLSQYSNKLHEIQDLLYMKQRLRTFGSSADRALDQMMETIYANMQWMANYNETINVWLRNNVEITTKL